MKQNTNPNKATRFKSPIKFWNPKLLIYLANFKSNKLHSL